MQRHKISFHHAKNESLLTTSRKSFKSIIILDIYDGANCAIAMTGSILYIGDINIYFYPYKRKYRPTLTFQKWSFNMSALNIMFTPNLKSCRLVYVSIRTKMFTNLKEKLQNILLVF